MFRVSNKLAGSFRHFSATEKLAGIFILVGLAIVVVPAFVDFGSWDWKLFNSASATRGHLELEKSIVIPIPAPLTSLDPQKAYSSMEKSFLLLPFSRLVKNGPELQTEADALERWEYDIDKKTMRIWIRPGLRFQDGREVDSEDVIFSFHDWATASFADRELLFLIDGAKEYSQGEAKAIRGLTALDRSTVEVRLGGFASDQLIRNLSQPRFCLYPKDFGGKTREEFFAAPLGTGPYKLISFSSDSSRFLAHPDYYLGAPATQNLELRYLEPSQARSAFVSGEVNNLALYHNEKSADLAADDTAVKQVSQTNTLALVFNSAHPWLKDEAARIYVTSLLDKARVIADCYPGSRVANGFIPPGLVGGANAAPVAPVPQPIPVPGTFEPRITLYAAPDENGACVLKTLQRQFNSLPFVYALRPYREIRNRLKDGSLPIWVESFEFKSADPLLNLKHFSSLSNEYFLGTPYPDLEKLFLKLDAEINWYQRSDIYGEIDRYLIDHRHIVPIAHFSNPMVSRKNVKGLDFLRAQRFATSWHQIRVIKQGSIP